jgi:hypothetical protein
MAELKKLRQTRKANQAEEAEKAPDPVCGDHLEKQSQSGVAQNDLSSFEQKEYELLLGPASIRNKANLSHVTSENRGQKTEVRGGMTENNPQKQILPIEYSTY